MYVGKKNFNSTNFFFPQHFQIKLTPFSFFPFFLHFPLHSPLFSFSLRQNARMQNAKWPRDCRSLHVVAGQSAHCHRCHAVACPSARCHRCRAVARHHLPKVSCSFFLLSFNSCVLFFFSVSTNSCSELFFHI